MLEVLKLMHISCLENSPWVCILRKSLAWIYKKVLHQLNLVFTFHFFMNPFRFICNCLLYLAYFFWCNVLHPFHIDTNGDIFSFVAPTFIFEVHCLLDIEFWLTGPYFCQYFEEFLLLAPGFPRFLSCYPLCNRLFSFFCFKIIFTQLDNYEGLQYASFIFNILSISWHVNLHLFKIWMHFFLWRFLILLFPYPFLFPWDPY